MPLMNTDPASIRGAIRRARSMSRVQTDAPSPYCESFASAIASSSSFARINAATGPERLFAKHRHLRGDAGDDRRREEVAVALEPRAAGVDVCTHRNGALELAFECVAE